MKSLLGFLKKVCRDSFLGFLKKVNFPPPPELLLPSCFDFVQIPIPSSAAPRHKNLLILRSGGGKNHCLVKHFPVVGSQD